MFIALSTFRVMLRRYTHTGQMNANECLVGLTKRQRFVRWLLPAIGSVVVTSKESEHSIRRTQYDGRRRPMSLVEKNFYYHYTNIYY